MPSIIPNRLRRFLKTKLSLQKERLLSEFRGEEAKRVEAERLKFECRIMALAHERGIEFDREKNGFVLDGFQHINSLILDLGAKLGILDDGRIEIRIGQASFVPDTPQEIGILTEIFVDEVYLVESRKPMYVWDVGANIATASLYFATTLGWDVSAYELFPQTAEMAKGNIDRSGLADKVRLCSFGVGAKTENLTLAYNEQSRGSNGLFGNTNPGVTGEGVQTSVKIVDAADEIQKVLELANGRPVLAKFDCEGAEYDIIPRLVQTGHIRSLAAIIMEEHLLPGHNREDLAAALLDAGFVVRRTRRLDKHVGMVFASRMG